MNLIVKIILSELVSGFSIPATAETQYFAHLVCNSTLQLISDISSDWQILLRFFDGTTVGTLFRISLSL